MTFTFPVKSEAEIQAMNLIDEGEYDFVVLSAEERISKNGNQMIQLLLSVFDMHGGEHHVYDYLVSTERMLFKIKHFCESVGIDYNAGEFHFSDCNNKPGRAHIVIQEANGKYLAKNSVRDYIPVDPNSVEVVKNGMPKGNDGFISDDVPF